MSDKGWLYYLPLWLLGVTALVLPLQPSVVGVPGLSWLVGWEAVVKLVVVALIWHGIIVVHPRLRLDTSVVLISLAVAGVLLGHTFLFSAYSPTPLLWQWVFFLLMVPAVAAAVSEYQAKSVAVLLVALGLQAQWAVLQFSWQRDLGMTLLGESHLGAALEGVAKFSVETHKVVRAYGPYSHPNSLAATMLLGLLFTVLTWQMIGTAKLDRAGRAYARTGLMAAGGLMLLALLLSFSRSAWAGLVIGTGMVGMAMRRSPWKLRHAGADQLAAKRSAFLVVGLGLLLSLLFLPLAWRRVVDWESVALRERVYGVSYAVDIIADHGWTGTGVGTYPLALWQWAQASGAALAPWEVTYVHMVPALAVAELGIFGVFLMLAGGRWLVRRRHVVVLFWPLLPAFFLDHFYYTYPAMWFWLVVFFEIHRNFGRRYTV